MIKKKYIAITLEVCKSKQLSPTDKLIFGRIAGFKQYFESSTSCAELFNLKVDTVRKVKQKLEKLGFIECVENHGRGKVYQVSDRWKNTVPADKTPSEKAVEKNDDDTNDSENKITRVILTASASENHKPRSKTWPQKYPHLMPVWKKSFEYLQNKQIPITDERALQKAIVATASLFDPGYEQSALLAYFDYLESPQYLYQVSKNKYCPRIYTQSDLFGKFSTIRDFSKNPDRQFDPRRDLTT